MKRRLVLAVTTVVILGAFAVAAFFCVTGGSEKKHHAICINQMQGWHAGAETYCLEYGVGPDGVLDLKTLRDYVHLNTQETCPSGKKPYQPFAVANGPVCPNGHDPAPGVQRPFMAVWGSKLCHIYETAGWTNMIVGKVEP
jgi:hypothetical protein